MLLKISVWHRITVPGEAGPTEAHEAAPFKPRRTTRPHTRPQGVGQNRTHTGPPFSRMEGGGGGAFTTGMMFYYLFIH